MSISRKINPVFSPTNFGYCSSKTMEVEHLFHAMNSNKEPSSTMPLWNPMLLLMTGAALGAIVAKKL